MAKRTMPTENLDPPATLEDHPFYGLSLDDEQRNFRDLIWNDNTDIVFVDAKAGSGKTMVAVATSVLLCRYHKYSSIYYVVNAVGDRQGFLPGDITTKSSVYLEPLYQALLTCNEMPERVIRGTPEVDKAGTGFITAITSTYTRGINIGNANEKTILIIDEAQNFTEFDLRKVLTRTGEGCKVIVIGHQLQCDLPSQKMSGFAPCMAHFMSQNNPRFAKCELHTCHRSVVAQVADEPWTERLVEKEKGND